MALLDPKGALGRTAGKLGLDAAGGSSPGRGSPRWGRCRQSGARAPARGRPNLALDLLDRATAAADQKGSHTVGRSEVALAAASSDQANIGPALRDAGWTVDKLTAALRSPEVMQPTEEKAAEAGGSVLAKYTRDLTEAARGGKIMPVVGRDSETRNVIQTLLRKTKKQSSSRR